MMLMHVLRVSIQLNLALVLEVLPIRKLSFIHNLNGLDRRQVLGLLLRLLHSLRKMVDT